jgi:mRNA-degrading endonuclease RelE of RelBE toxin-antitoxin system
MKVLFSEHFAKSFKDAPEKIQKDFGKQLAHLLKDLRYPSLKAKKYDEHGNIWQARVNDNWRFYFRIEGDIYHLIDIISHP